MRGGSPTSVARPGARRVLMILARTRTTIAAIIELFHLVQMLLRTLQTPSFPLFDVEAKNFTHQVWNDEKAEEGEVCKKKDGIKMKDG